MIFLDNILAFVATYAMSTPINNQEFTVNQLWWYYFIQNSLVFIFMIVYIYIRLYTYSVLIDRYPWEESSLIFRCLYVIINLFSYTIAPMIFVNSALIFFIGIILNSWKGFLWLSECLLV